MAQYGAGSPDLATAAERRAHPADVHAERRLGTYDHDVGAHSDIEHAPAPFVAAVEQLAEALLRPELVITAMPPPKRIAPYAHAVTGDVMLASDEVATGRFVLLHDPLGPDAWGGTFRCVTFAQAEIEVDLATDPSLPGVGWSWLRDALASRGADYVAAGGNVTVIRSEAYGELADSVGSSQIEVRASWTPVTSLADHLGAWAELLGSLAGLPPLTPDVVPLPRRPRSGP